MAYRGDRFGKKYLEHKSIENSNSKYRRTGDEELQNGTHVCFVLRRTMLSATAHCLRCCGFLVCLQLSGSIALAQEWATPGTNDPLLPYANDDNCGIARVADVTDLSQSMLNSPVIVENWASLQR